MMILDFGTLINPMLKIHNTKVLREGGKSRMHIRKLIFL